MRKNATARWIVWMGIFFVLAACNAPVPEPVVVVVTPTSALASTPTPSPTQPYAATLQANQTQNAIQAQTRAVYAENSAATAAARALTPSATPRPPATTVPATSTSLIQSPPQDFTLPGIGTPFVQSGESIQEANLDRLMELARWGKGRVVGLALSGDGQLLAVASPNGVYFYDVDSLELRDYLNFFEELSSLALSQNGRLVALGFWNGRVKVVDLSTLALVQEFGVQNSPWSLAFAGDDRYLVSKSESIFPPEIWSLETRRFEELEDIVGGEADQVIISIDGRTILVFSGTEMQFWDWEKGFTGPVYQADADPYYTGITRNSEYFALISPWENYRVYRVDSGELLWSGDAHCYECYDLFDAREHYPNCEYGFEDAGSDAMKDISISPDGRFIVTNFIGRTEVREIETGALVQQIYSSSGMALSADGRLAAWDAAGEIIHLANADTWNEVGTIPGFTGGVYDLVFEPSGNRLLIEYWDVFRLRSLATGGLFRTFDVNDVSFSADGALVALAHNNGLVEVRSNFDLGLVHAFSMDTYPVQDLAFSNDGRSLFSAHDCRVFRTDTASWSTALNVTTEWGPVGVSLTPDDLYLMLFGGRDFYAYPLSSSEVSLTDVGGFSHGQEYFGYALDLSGLAASLWGGSVRLDAAAGWDVIARGALSPDARLLADFTYEGTIEIWRVADGALLANFTNSAGSLSSIAFSPDGRFIAVGSYDGTVSIWGIAP